MRKLTLSLAAVSALSAGILTASPAFASGPDPVNSGDINATVTVQDTIAMTGVGNSVPFGSGSPGDTLDVPAAISPVITVLHHGGATLNVVPQNGGFKYAAGTGDVISDTAVTINGTQLANATPVPLQVIDTGTNAQSFPEDWKLNIPATPEPGTQFDNTTPLFADFELQLVAN